VSRVFIPPIPGAIPWITGRSPDWRRGVTRAELVPEQEDVMASNHGGDAVKGGYYWNLQKWDATFVEGPAGELPGSSNEIYRRIPTLALLFAAPIMGALFVMFLPFIGIALLLQHITRAAIEAAGDTIERVLRSVSPAWRPGMAFLAGKARRARHEDKPAVSPELEALGKDIEERRKND
jgi:hypothetical protein